MPDSTSRIDCGDAAYERFFVLFAAYGVAHTASKEVFPCSTWQAIYKRIKKNPELYQQYRQIAADTGQTRVQNALAGRTDQIADLCRLIASGIKVYAAVRQVFPDRNPRDVIAEINKDPGLAEDFAAARKKRQVLCRAADKLKRHARDDAYRQKVRSDPVLLARRRELHRRSAARHSNSEVWRLRKKLIQAVSKEARALGVSTKEIHRLWKVPTLEEWRWQCVDYSKHNVQE